VTKRTVGQCTTHLIPLAITLCVPARFAQPCRSRAPFKRAPGYALKDAITPLALSSISTHAVKLAGQA
jgi:hypothetical protein